MGTVRKDKLQELFRGRLGVIWKKAAVPILLLLLGLLLLAPWERQEKNRAVDASSANAGKRPSLLLEEDCLEEILMQVEGAGKVRVLLSCEAGERTEYASDGESQTQQRQEEVTARDSKKTVTVSAGSGHQTALPVVTQAPVYRGAVVVCQGADNPSVKLALVQAVASLTGLSSNQIVIMKMK